MTDELELHRVVNARLAFARQKCICGRPLANNYCLVLIFADPNDGEGAEGDQLASCGACAVDMLTNTAESMRAALAHLEEVPS